MERLLMQLGYTAGQAAVRAPLYAGLVICQVTLLVGLLLWELDRAGCFDRLGDALGLVLRRLLNYTHERR